MAKSTHLNRPTEKQQANAPRLGQLACLECDQPAHPELPVALCLDHARRVFVWVLLNDQRDGVAGLVADSRAHTETAGVVYFLLFRDRVKIGWSRNLANRLRAIPHDRVLHTEPGTMRDENRIHAAFAADRDTGEWFHYSDDLRRFIHALQQRAA